MDMRRENAEKSLRHMAETSHRDRSLFKCEIDDLKSAHKQDIIEIQVLLLPHKYFASNIDLVNYKIIIIYFN
jgi:hypothetical protein